MLFQTCQADKSAMLGHAVDAHADDNARQGKTYRAHADAVDPGQPVRPMPPPCINST